MRKKKEQGIPVAVRGAECSRGGGGDRPFPNRFASGKKKDRPFQGVWCAWDPAVRTSGALAFSAQVFDTKELVSQDHSAPPTPHRLCGNRRFRFK